MTEQKSDSEASTLVPTKRKSLPTAPLPSKRRDIKTPPSSIAPDANHTTDISLTFNNAASSRPAPLDLCLTRLDPETIFELSPGAPDSTPKMDCIDCRLGSETCQTSNKPRTRKAVTWAPEVVFHNHNQKQLHQYQSQDFPKRQDWWDVPAKVDAFEMTLRTGKLLEALQNIPHKEICKLADSLPVPLIFTVKNAIFDYRGDTTDDYNVLFDTASNDPELALHRREILHYLDSRLDDLIFCRYQGRLLEPDPCPKFEMQRQRINDVYELGLVNGPSGYIVNNWDRSDRPLAWPIRFSQAYMAMKYHRAGKKCKTWISNLSAHLAYSVRDMANHWWSSEPLLWEGRLLVRTQSWVYIPNMDAASKEYLPGFLSGNEIVDYEKPDQITWACRHLNASPHLKSIYDFKNPEDAAQVRRCTECAMEYQINTLKSIPTLRFLKPNYIVPDNAFCALITVWRDFGRCLTPFDPRWQTHFIGYDEDEEECATDWTVGGIKRAFEGVDEYMEFEYALDERSQVEFLVSTEASRKLWREEEERKAAEKKAETEARAKKMREKEEEHHKKLMMGLKEKRADVKEKKKREAFEEE